jgi:hypothetical protein
MPAAAPGWWLATWPAAAAASRTIAKAAESRKIHSMQCGDPMLHKMLPAALRLSPPRHIAKQRPASARTCPCSEACTVRCCACWLRFWAA